MAKALELVANTVDGTINVVKAIPSWLTFPKAIEQTTRTAQQAIVRVEDSYRNDVLPDFQKTTLTARNCIDGVAYSVRNCVDTVAYAVKIFSGIVVLLLICVLILAVFVGPQVFGVFTLAFNVLTQALTLISRALDVFSLMLDLVYRIMEAIIRTFNSFSKALAVLLDSCDLLFAKIHLYDLGLPLLILLIIMINVRFVKRIKDIFNKADYPNETAFERNDTASAKHEHEQKQTNKMEQNSGTGTTHRHNSGTGTTHRQKRKWSRKVNEMED